MVQHIHPSHIQSYSTLCAFCPYSVSLDLLRYDRVLMWLRAGIIHTAWCIVRSLPIMLVLTQVCFGIIWCDWNDKLKYTTGQRFDLWKIYLIFAFVLRCTPEGLQLLQGQKCRLSFCHLSQDRTKCQAITSSFKISSDFPVFFVRLCLRDTIPWYYMYQDFLNFCNPLKIWINRRLHFWAINNTSTVVP